MVGVGQAHLNGPVEFEVRAVVAGMALLIDEVDLRGVRKAQSHRERGFDILVPWEINPTQHEGRVVVEKGIATVFIHDFQGEREFELRVEGAAPYLEFKLAELSGCRESIDFPARRTARNVEATCGKIIDVIGRDESHSKFELPSGGAIGRITGDETKTRSGDGRGQEQQANPC